jgi:hypothetical protein
LINQVEGARREAEVAGQLARENPGATIQGQTTLRRPDGSRAIDPDTGKGRRVDHAVIEGSLARTVETTSPTADKTAQSARESRIHEAGPVVVRNRSTGDLVPVPRPSEVRRRRRQRTSRSKQNGRFQRCQPARRPRQGGSEFRRKRPRDPR